MRRRGEGRLFLLLCLVAFRAATGAQVYDFSAQGTEDVDVPAFGVGDRIVLAGPEATSFALEIVSAPPPGIVGRSFLAKDLLKVRIVLYPDDRKV